METAIDLFSYVMENSPTLHRDEIMLTNHFGDFIIKTDTIITITLGIIGFSSFKQYAIVKMPTADETPFRLFIAVDEPHLSFIIFPTTANNALIEEEDVEKVCERNNIDNKNDLLLLHLASIKENEKMGHKITLNLKAPIVINAKNRTGEQYIFTEKDYNLHYKMDGNTIS